MGGFGCLREKPQKCQELPQASGEQCCEREDIAKVCVVCVCKRERQTERSNWRERFSFRHKRLLKRQENKIFSGEHLTFLN